MKRFKDIISEAKFSPGEEVMVKLHPNLGSKKKVPTKVKLILIDNDGAVIEHQGKRYNIPKSSIKKI